MVSNRQLVAFGQIPWQRQSETPSGLQYNLILLNLDSVGLILKRQDWLHNGNNLDEQTSDFVFLFFHYSLVFSTQLSLAAFNHHFIQDFIWITVAFISSTSAAQRKVCRAPRRLVYRGKVSHVLSGVSLQMMTVGSAEPQSPNESLMRGSQGEFGGVTAEAAAMLEDVSQKACRQEMFK